MKGERYILAFFVLVAIVVFFTSCVTKSETDKCPCSHDHKTDVFDCPCFWEEL